MSPFTTDSLGSLQIKQHSKGYRFSIDPLLLAWHIQPRPGEHILDPGTGCGILSLLLARKQQNLRITAVEIQPELAALARHNVQENQMGKTIEILETDMRLLSQKQLCGPVDRIVINPPYYRQNCGRTNPGSEKATARHEIHINLEEWTKLAASLLKTGGRLHCIFPAERCAELLCAMNLCKITPKNIRNVHSTAQSPASLVLAEGILGAGHGCSLAPPLILYKTPDTYSDEARQILWPENETFLHSPVDRETKSK
ncbi:tRNA1Val (adenine37-N6)-methyltransferase [Desulfobotulus alkaliphilus]|uniref:tRNA1Val (Adenine37-N6)-methyltransferase n=1 Tax=Desulfobotulus alkaliphilus TaxID=622671 RepID=A0A562RT94_9BACT|nr:methyltransferase [Desulfobotulus alkaliphilus]TWI71794.1 tRNA1Val (adenine37-N6)-methyltransferase [Desulfobotulus alkaliphilus]